MKEPDNFEYTFWNFRDTDLFRELQKELTPPRVTSNWGKADHISDLLSAGMFYETHTLLQFYNLLPEEGLILDIGANIGNHQLMFNQLWPGRSIMGFEGSPLNYSHLFYNTRQFPNILNFCICLGEESGIGELVHFSDNMGGSGLTSVTKKTIEETATHPVIIQKLDSFSFDTKISLIKIDIEHFELQALKGGYTTLKEHTPDIWIEDFKYGNEEERDQSAIRFLQTEFNYNIVENNECNYLLKVKS